MSWLAAVGKDVNEIIRLFLFVPFTGISKWKGATPTGTRSEKKNQWLKISVLKSLNESWP